MQRKHRSILMTLGTVLKACSRALLWENTGQSNEREFCCGCVKRDGAWASGAEMAFTTVEVVAAFLFVLSQLTSSKRRIGIDGSSRAPATRV